MASHEVTVNPAQMLETLSLSCSNGATSVQHGACARPRSESTASRSVRSPPSAQGGHTSKPTLLNPNSTSWIPGFAAGTDYIHDRNGNETGNTYVASPPASYTSSDSYIQAASPPDSYARYTTTHRAGDSVNGNGSWAHGAHPSSISSITSPPMSLTNPSLSKEVAGPITYNSSNFFPHAADTRNGTHSCAVQPFAPPPTPVKSHHLSASHDARVETRGQVEYPPAPSRPLIPQSGSCHSFSTTQQTPRQSGDNGVGYPFSPEESALETQTEPRNYAPRTPGLPATQEPPPKFNIGVIPYKAQENGHDPFVHNQIVSIQAPVYQSLPVVPAPAPYPPIPISSKLSFLMSTPSGMPSLQMAMDSQNFPFVECGKRATAVNHGVVRMKNIPFSAKRAEVIAFLGRNSKILNDIDEPVHIIMERVTSKTMDAYVEFTTLEDAMKAVERHHQNLVNGRLSRLGDRPVDMELSSQACLMKDLFPLASGLVWDGVTPEFKPHNPTDPWENFKGFISEEEMTMLVKHVEVPHRSPFSKECPQRPYECLISTIKKFPWAAMDRITVRQRRAIFKATCELIRLLSRSLQRGDDPINLSQQLFRRVTVAAMSCPGFTPLMKDDIAWTINMSDQEQRAYGQPRFANRWRHQYALAPKPGMPLDVVEWYISVIRDQTQRDTLNRTLEERNRIQEGSEDTDLYWGHFWAEVGYTMGPQFDDMTLAQAAHAEFSAVERVLARALPRN